MSDDRLKDISADGTPQNSSGLKRRDLLLGSSTLLAASAMSSTGLNPAQAQNQASTVPGASGRPNILLIMADDVGVWNLSTYHRGMMGGRTPNIDRIAQEGALFTDYYGQQSCTAGRSAFITGQHPFRTGLLKVGLPGSPLGLQNEDPTIAELLKPQGYATAQIGKNHLGDRNEFLPTVHGFDEFFGNLYHLNAEEEPEDPDYPKSPEFAAKFGPRGMLHTFATDKDDPTADPRFGKVGKQTIQDTGPLTRKRMETVEKEMVAASLDFMDRSAAAKKPFFLWHNTSRMHVNTHLSTEWKNKSGFGLYADGMMELDWVIGQLLKSSMTLESLTTPSSSSPATTELKNSLGRTGAPCRFAAKRAPRGRAAFVSRPWRAGRGSSSRARS